jgi:hypothetical protein
MLLAFPLCAQTLDEQFEVRLAGDEFGRVCPAFDVPTVHVQPGELVSFEILIRATRSIAIRTGVILPSGETASLEQSGAFPSPQLPATLSAGSEALSYIEWIPSSIHSGSYRLRFVASVTTEFGDIFSICDVPVDVVSEGSGEACTLTNAVDGFDGDTGIDFGEVEVGSSSSGVALLGFSVPASSAAGDGEIFHCLPEEVAVSAFPGQLVGDFLVVELAYTPTVPEDLAAEVSFYHAADAGGQDLCDPVLAAENSCVRRLQLSGRSTASVVSVEFQNQVCGEAPTTDVVLRNETAGDLIGLSVDMEPPFAISSLDTFSIRDFSLGPSGTASAGRRLRIEFPANPDEHLGGVLFVDSGNSRLLQAIVPAPNCVSVFPLSLDFGETNVDTVGVRTGLIVNNTAEAISAVLSVTPSDRGFGTGITAITLESNTSEEFELQFSPPRLGRLSAELRFENADLANVPSISLSGTGVQNPGLVLSFQSAGVLLSARSSVVFPDTNLRTTSSRTLTIANEGKTTARGLRLLSTRADFEVTPQEAIDLAPGVSSDFVLTFRPKEVGRSIAVLSVTGLNFEEQTFFLQGEGVLGRLTAVATGLDASVSPRQTNPYPAVGLELALPAPESLVGVLTIALNPGTLAVDPSVRFLATGLSIPFRIDAESTVARFVGEPDARRARYQSGTVAGLIRFSVSELTTISGNPVEVAGGVEVGATRVPRLAPVILDSVQCTLTRDGIELSAQGLSTLREITGVALNLKAASGTVLNFAPPPEDFANSLFLAWFSDPGHNQHGGLFRFSIPIAFTDMRTFGSASVRLRNSVGWSDPATVENNVCR